MSDQVFENHNSSVTHRDAQAMLRYDANKKSVGVAYALWFFFGAVGGHRFYLKQTGTAIVMLILFLASIVLSVAIVGFFGFIVLGLWVLVDIFLIPGLTRTYNNQLISSLNM
ncbi:MAG: TM2 domain-containing protein [Acetobacteraceae bacterium]|nr:TM2 domain-containing protein [Acetobacteraceae bacterium]